MSSPEKLNILYEHYKDNVLRAREYELKRDKFLWLSLGILMLTFTQAYFPDTSNNLISELFEKKLEVKIPLDILGFVGSIVWFSLFIILMQYFQAVLHISKLYKYNEKIEKSISILYDLEVFNRDGEFYKNQSNPFNSWSKHIYKTFYPITLLFIVFWKIKIEIFLNPWLIYH